MQILGSCRPSASQDLLTCMSACIDEVAAWMRSNWLQLSTAKAQFLWSTTSHRLYQLPQSLLRVGSDHISPAFPVRDFVIYVDSDDLMRSRVAKTVSACYSVLHQLRTVRRRLRLLSCVISACMLYYCNTVRWAWLDWGLSRWLTTLLQCFDTVGWVIRPIKTVGRITYIVLAQT